MPRMFVVYPKDTNHHPGSGDFNQVLDAIQKNAGGTHGGVYTQDMDVAVNAGPTTPVTDAATLYANLDGSTRKLYFRNDAAVDQLAAVFDTDYDGMDMQDENRAFYCHDLSRYANHTHFFDTIARKKHGSRLEFFFNIDGNPGTAKYDEVDSYGFGLGFAFGSTELDLNAVGDSVRSTVETIRDDFSIMGMVIGSGGTGNTFRAAAGGDASFTPQGVDIGDYTSSWNGYMSIDIPAAATTASGYTVTIKVNGSTVFNGVAPLSGAGEDLIYPYVVTNIQSAALSHSFCRITEL